MEMVVLLLLGLEKVALIKISPDWVLKSFAKYAVKPLILVHHYASQQDLQMLCCMPIIQILIQTLYICIFCPYHYSVIKVFSAEGQMGSSTSAVNQIVVEQVDKKHGNYQY